MSHDDSAQRMWCSGITGKDEAGPIVRICVSLTNLCLCQAQGVRITFAFFEIFVERNHELLCGLIVDAPKTGNNRRCPGVNESSSETRDVVTPSPGAELRLTPTQHHQIRVLEVEL